MNRSPQRTLMWMLIVAFALHESLALAQPELAKKQANAANVTAPMPDIEGVWEAKGTESERHSVAKNVRKEIIIRRSKEGDGFVLASHPIAVPLTWSATSKHFWGGYIGNDKVELRLELSVVSDANALRVKRELVRLDGTVTKDTSEVHYVRIYKTTPPDIAGSWRIVRWGNSAHLLQSIQIESHDSTWKGTYRDWAKTARGEIEMTWSPESRQFMGTWSEGGNRSGKLTIRLLPDGKTIRGSWTTDAGSRTSDKEPAHSDLEWVRADTDEGPSKSKAEAVAQATSETVAIKPTEQSNNIQGVWKRSPEDATRHRNLWIRASKPNETFELTLDGDPWAPLTQSSNNHFHGTQTVTSEDGTQVKRDYELTPAEGGMLHLKMTMHVDTDVREPATFEADYIRKAFKIPEVDVKRPEPAAEIKVFTLANGDAADYVKLLRGIFSDVKFQADTRTNQIIAVFKKRESAQMVEALLLRLDETKTPLAVSFTKAGGDPSHSRSPQELIAEIDGREHRALTLAQQIRQQGPKHPDSAKAREELDSALRAALQLKFQQEQQQLQQLAERLSRLQQQLEFRQATASKIVERRAQELLEGDLKWNAESSGAPQSDESTNRSVTKLSSSRLPLPVHTEVKFLEPKGQQWSVVHDQSLVDIPGAYRFERDAKRFKNYKIQLQSVPNGEPTITGYVSIPPLDVPLEIQRQIGPIPLALSYEDRRQIRLGNKISIGAFARQVDGKYRVDLIPMQPYTSVGEARRHGIVLATFYFEESTGRLRKFSPDEVPEELAARVRAQRDNESAAWDPKIHIDIVENAEFKLDDMARFNLGTFTGVAKVSVIQIDAPKGTPLKAVVHDPSGICREESREQSISRTKLEIEEGLRTVGIKDIRWVEDSKAGDASTKAQAETDANELRMTIEPAKPSRIPQVRIDVYSGPDRKQSLDVKDKLVFALQDLTGASILISDISEPKGDAVVAIVREWRGQASLATKQQINAAFKYAGIQDVRWEQRPKLAEEGSTPANQTQIQFKGPQGMRMAVNSSGDRMPFSYLVKFDRTDGIRRTYLRLFPEKVDVAYPAAIDIYDVDARASAFLTTNTVPIEVTDADLQLMKEQKNVTKFVYLPDHGDAEQTSLKLESLVSSNRTDGDPDPFSEVRRRGQLVAVFYLGPQSVLETTNEKDPIASWVWDNLRFRAKPVSDAALVPVPFHGGLQITEINGASNQMQQGDILIGMANWQTLSLDNVIFAAERVKPPDSSGSRRPLPLPIYLLRKGELVVARSGYTGRQVLYTPQVSPANPISIEQWTDLLQRKTDSNELSYFDVMRRVVEMASGASAKERHQVAMALFLKGETLDPFSKTDGPLYHEIIQLLQKLPDEDLLPLQIEILQGGGPARTLLAAHSLKKLRDYTTNPEFPKLVEQLWRLSGSEERWLRVSILSLFAETLSLTNMKPEELSTEERRQMVERLIEVVPHQKVIDLLSSSLQSPQIEIALYAAQLLKGQPEDREPVIVQKKVEILIKVLKGQLGETKASREQRAMSLTLLGSLGGNAAPAVPTLIELLQHDDPDMKADEAEGDKLGPGRGRPAFTGERIVSLLGTIGPAASAALPELEARLKLVEKQEREEAILSPDPRTRQYRSITSSGLTRAIDRIKGERER